MAKKLTAAGLRALIREEATRGRRRSRLVNESLMARPEVDEAMSTLVDTVIDAMIEDEMASADEMDEMHTELMNELGDCVTEFVYQ